MKKLLTTITLLCFSIAANAEIYVCELKTTTFSYDTGVAAAFSLEAGNYPEPGILILDTEKGWRETNSVFGEDYRGVCTSQGLYVICKDELSHGYLTVSIKKEELTFLFSQHMYGGSSYAKGGTCTKA
jgi:hypothetical protein